MQRQIHIQEQRAQSERQGIEDFYALRIGPAWRYLRSQHFSFWMICGYLITEYVRPQSIIPALDILPWAQVFLLLALIGRLLDKQAKWVSDPANVWISLFLATIIVSCFLAVFPDTAWSYFMYFFSWYVIYFLIINIVTSEKRLLIFLALFLLASFKLSLSSAKTWALRGFAFTNWGLMGPEGFFQNSGELSIQMLMFSPIAYELAMHMRPHVSKVKFYVLLAMPLTAAMTVIGASSRGAQIALVYQAYRSMLKGRFSLKKVLLVVLVALTAYHLLPEEQKERFSSAGSDNTSEQRLLYWQHGIEIIKERPILGIGYFNFPPYYEQNYPQDMLFAHAELPHNIFIQIGTDAGLVGLFIFAMLIYRTIASARRIRELAALADDKQTPFACLARGMLIAMWGFIIAGQFVTVTYYPFFWVNLAMIVALRNIAEQHYASLGIIEKKARPAVRRQRAVAG